MCTNLLLSVPVYPGASTPRVYVSARVFEITPNLPMLLCLVPEQQQFPQNSLGTLAKPQKWTNQYGYVGVTPPTENTSSTPMALFPDGLNQSGLSVGALWFPGATYPKTSGAPHEVWFSDFTAWMLGNFDSVSDLQSALTSSSPAISVVGPAAPTGPKNPEQYYPLHFIATDNTGQSVIVEFVSPDGSQEKAEMIVYGPGQPLGVPTCATGVLTNFPAYDEQINNLALYQNLTLIGTTTTIGGSGPPVGSGLIGLPGDPTPQSRFVRAAILSNGFPQLPSDGTGWLPAPPGDKSTQKGFADPVQTVVNSAMQLVQICEETPYGMLLATNSPPPPAPPYIPGDWTQWTLARDHTNLNYYFTTAFNNVPQVIEFDQTDFTAPSGWSLDSAATIPFNPPDPAVAWCYPASFPSSS